MKTLRSRIFWIMVGLFLWELVSHPSRLDWVMTANVELGLAAALVLTYLPFRIR